MSWCLCLDSQQRAWHWGKNKTPLSTPGELNISSLDKHQQFPSHAEELRTIVAGATMLAAWPHRTLHRGRAGGAGSASIVPPLAAGSAGRSLPACAWAAAAWQPDTGTRAPPLLPARAVSSHLAASLSVRRAEGPENTGVIQVHLLASHLRWRRSWSDVAAVASSSVHSLWSLHIAATRPPGDTPGGRATWQGLQMDSEELRALCSQVLISRR